MRNGSKHTCSTSRIRRTCARMHARPTAPAAIFASLAYLTTGRRCSFGSSSRMCTAPPTACTTKSPSNMCLSVSGFVEHSESSVKPCDEFISYRNRSNKIKTSRLLLEKIKSSRLCSWDFPLYFHATMPVVHRIFRGYLYSQLFAVFCDAILAHLRGASSGRAQALATQL